MWVASHKRELEQRVYELEEQVAYLTDMLDLLVIPSQPEPTQAQATLSANEEAYNKIRPTLIQEGHQGKWVVIEKEAKPQFFDTYSAACDAAAGNLFSPYPASPIYYQSLIFGM